MPADDAQDFEEIERRMNIHKLQNEAKELVGGEFFIEESDDCPPEVLEQFWSHVVDYERAPITTLEKKLQEENISLPAPDELDAEQLQIKLWQIIDWLATRQTFLHNTDHLSDKELYQYLVEEALREPVRDMPVHPDAHLHIDLIGSGSEEDVLMNFRFYATEEDREHWAQMFPDYEFPEREEPPFDRDQHLPQARYDHAFEDDDEED